MYSHVSTIIPASVVIVQECTEGCRYALVFCECRVSTVTTTAGIFFERRSSDVLGSLARALYEL